jgi:hypothetical protein
MSQFDSIRFTPGRPLTKELGSERLNAIITEIKRNKPKGERGITVRQDGTGTYIGLAASLPRGTSAPATRQPWDLIARVDPDANPADENPPYLARVQPGALNGFLPTNWDDEFELAGTGLHYAKAIVATDGQAMTGVTIEIDTSAPTTQAPQEFGIVSSIEILFGLFLEGSAYRLIGPGNIAASPKLWITTERQTPPAPGEIPFSQYFFFR